MWSNTWGDTTQSRNNTFCRCAHTGVIFSPPHHGILTGRCSLEAIDTTRGYVTQTGGKEEDTVGIKSRKKSHGEKRGVWAKVGWRWVWLAGWIAGTSWLSSQ